MNKPNATILVIEDDENDAFFFQRALLKARPDLSFHRVSDGEQAIDYLNGRGSYVDREAHPLPEVIFLDLKLPYLSGFEVLEQLRAEPKLRDIEVFILTSSSEERDRRRALELGVKSYLVKPPTMNMLLGALGNASQSRA